MKQTYKKGARMGTVTSISVLLLASILFIALFVSAQPVSDISYSYISTDPIDINITWAPSTIDNFSNYTITRSNDTNPTPVEIGVISNPNTNFIVDGDLGLDTTYTYTITVFNTTGGNWSNTIEISIPSDFSTLQIISVIAPLTQVNAGEEFFYNVQWTYPTSAPDYTIYICSTNAVSASAGCTAQTYSSKAVSMSDSPGPVLLNQTPQNYEDEEFTAHIFVCSAFLNTCSGSQEVTILVNNRPTADNVTVLKTISGPDTFATCNYDFVSNGPDNDYDSSQTRFRWIHLSSNGLINDNFENGTGDTFKTISVTGESGAIACEVKTVDTKGAIAENYVRSEFKPITSSAYLLNTTGLPTLTNLTTLSVIGKTTTSNSQVTAYIYQNNNPFGYTLIQTETFATNNPIINTSTSAPGFTSPSGTTIVQVNNDLEGTNRAMFNNSVVEKFIGFANHNKENFTYYGYEIISVLPDVLVLNLTTPLEETIGPNTGIRLYSYKNMTGRFMLNLNLFENSNNTIQLLANDGGHKTFDTLFVDTIAPSIQIASNLSNSSHIVSNGILNLTITDLPTIESTTFNITISNGTINETFTTINQWRTTGTILPVTSFGETSNSTTRNFVLTLGTLSYEQYSISIGTIDAAGNSNTLEKQFTATENIIPPIQETNEILFEQFIAPATIRNEGNSFNYSVFWTAPQGEYNLFICSTNNFSINGCVNETIANKTRISPPVDNTVPTIISYTAQQTESPSLTVFAIICKDNTCSAIRNVSVDINNRPRSENVSVSKNTIDNRVILTCNYDYFKPYRNGDDEDISATRFRWWIIDNNGNINEHLSTSNNPLIGNTGRSIDVTDLEGSMYCGVQVVDIHSAMDQTYRLSSNHESVTENLYEITIRDIPSSFESIWYEVIGLTQEPNTAVSVTIFDSNAPFNFRQYETTSFNTINNPVNTTQTALQSLVNETMIYISNNLQNRNKLNISTGNKYIRFTNHEKENLTYYEYTIHSISPTYIAINLTTPLEATVPQGTQIEIFAFQQKTGRFSTQVELFEERNNTLFITANDGGSFTSTPFFVKEIISGSDEESSSEIEIQNFFGPSNPVKSGSTFNYNVFWTAPQGTYNIFICSTANITTNGCVNETIAERKNVLPPQELATTQVSYTMTNQEDEQLTTFIRICSSTMCSEVKNTTVFVNNRPTAENVRIVKSTINNEVVLECAYDFIANQQIDDRNSAGTMYRWWKIDNAGDIVEQTQFAGIGLNGKFATVTALTGRMYCGVKVVDTAGIQDTSFRLSNIVDIADTAYQINIMPTPPYTNTPLVTITGITQTAGTEILAIVYKNGNVGQVKTNTTESLPFTNVFIDSTIAVQSSSKNETLIYIANDDLGVNQGRINNSATEKFIGFSNHNRSNFMHYNYTIQDVTHQFIILNLSTPLEEGIFQGDEISIYNRKEMRGRFTFNVPLFENGNNTIQLFANDGGTKVITPFIYVDTLPPTISLENNGFNESRIKKDGVITLEINDTFSLENLNVSFEIANETHAETFNSINEFVENSTILKIDSSIEEISTKTQLRNHLILSPGIKTGTYTITINATDYLENTKQEIFTFTHNNTQIYPKDFLFKDNITNEIGKFNSDSVLLNFNFSGTEIGGFVVRVFSENLGVPELLDFDFIVATESHTEIYENVAGAKGKIPKNIFSAEDLCIYFEMETVSSYGIFNSTRTPCYPFERKLSTPVNVTIKDSITNDLLRLRSNRITVSWDTENKNLIDTYTVTVFNNITGQIGQSTSNQSERTFTIPNLVTGSCYYANITATTIIGDSINTTTSCILFDEDNNLYSSIISPHRVGNQLLFNEDMNFTIQTINVNNVSFTIFNKDQNTNVTPKTTITTNFFADSVPVSLQRSSLGLGNTFYDLVITSSGMNQQKDDSYTIIFDTVNPQVINQSTEVEFYNDEELFFSIEASDNYGIRNVIFRHNATGILKDETMILLGNSQTPNFKTYGISLSYALKSNTHFSYTIIAKDFAGNTNETTEETVFIKNRAPLVKTNISSIYWNSSAFYGEVLLGPFFMDPDGDSLNFSILQPNLIDGDILINRDTGNLFGNLIGNTQFENNFTIRVTDSNGAYLDHNLSLYAIEGGCEGIDPTNSVFVGFVNDCTTNIPQPTPPVQQPTPPSTSPGSGGGSPSSGGTFSGSGITQVPSVQDRDFATRTIASITPQVKQTVTFNQEVGVREISFTYEEQVQNAVIEIRRLERLPSFITIDVEIYDIIQITSSRLLNRMLSDVAIIFPVRKNNDLGITRSNAIVYRWNNGVIETYPLTLQSEDMNTYFFKAEVPGFSYWILSVDRSDTREPPTIKDPRDEEKQPTPRPEPIPPTTEIPRPDQEVPSTSVNFILFAVLATIIMGAFGSFAFFYYKKNSYTNSSNQFNQKDVNPKENNKEQVTINPLPEYIKRHLQKGILEEKIKATLIEAGWKKEDIEHAFTEVKKSDIIDLQLIDHDLVEHAIHLHSKNMSKKEIEEELQSRHISELIVKTNVTYMYEVLKLEKEIVVWIKRGYTKQEIKEHLLKLKWPAITIYSILKKYN